MFILRVIKLILGIKHGQKLLVVFSQVVVTGYKYVYNAPTHIAKTLYKAV